MEMQSKRINKQPSFWLTIGYVGNEVK